MSDFEDNILPPLECYIKQLDTTFNAITEEQLTKWYDYIKNYDGDGEIDYEYLNIDCINCEKCVACIGCCECIDCSACFACVGCEICDRCNECFYCRYCEYCNNCMRCNECKNCKVCYKCTVADNMTDCKTCSCNNCVGCVNCDNCNYCINCIKCVNCNNCNKCIDTEDSNMCINIENYGNRDNFTYEERTGKIIPISNSNMFRYKVIYDAGTMCKSGYKIFYNKYLNNFISGLSNLYEINYQNIKTKNGIFITSNDFMDDTKFINNLKCFNILNKINDFEDLDKLLTMIEELYLIDEDNKIIKDLIDDFKYLEIKPVLKQLEKSCPKYFNENSKNENI